MEEDIITYPHIEIKYLTKKWIPHDKTIHKTRILHTQQKNIIDYSRQSIFTAVNDLISKFNTKSSCNISNKVVEFIPYVLQLHPAIPKIGIAGC